jgi:hypothetical protein
LLYRGLKLGALGFYERFQLAFSGVPVPAKIGTSALDQYFGAVIVVGYAF